MVTSKSVDKSTAKKCFDRIQILLRCVEKKLIVGRRYHSNGLRNLNSTARTPKHLPFQCNLRLSKEESWDQLYPVLLKAGTSDGNEHFCSPTILSFFVISTLRLWKKL